MGKNMHFTLEIWRQDQNQKTGHFETYEVENISPDLSFLEMLDVLNQKLIHEQKRPIEFDNDCREGICGMCSLVINGKPHGSELGTATCQLHMRKFQDGEKIIVEPWRARSFPVVRDLVVDRSALDRLIQSGGYISAKTGPKPDANSIPIGKKVADLAMDAAACIGCGACVAACPNASASLFVGAKIAQLAWLPQGKVEEKKRIKRMIAQMDQEGFGNCSNYGECAAACPKEIPISVIAKLKRQWWKAFLACE